MSTTDHYHRDNTIVATDGNPHLTLPSYALHAVPVSSKRRATALDEPKVLRRTAQNVTPHVCIIARDQALHNAITCRTFANLHREAIAKAHGDKATLNRFPISGGICEHWTRAEKDLVIAYVHLAQAHTALALAWHLYAGKRAHTFQANQ